MEISPDAERQQLEEDIRQIDEALLPDNDGELYGSDLEGSRQSEDEAPPILSSYDDAEPHNITQQPSTSHAFGKEDDFEGSSQENNESGEEDDDEEPSMHQLLVLNRKYQEYVVSNLEKVKDALRKNRIMQAELLDYKKRDREFPAAPSKFTPPYFKDRNFLSPPSNEDTVAISKKGYPVPVHVTLPRTWTKQELINLRKGVKADGLEKLMKPLLNQREIVEVKLKKAREERDKESRRVLVKEIGEIDVKLAELKVMPEETILGDLKRDVDWHKVANCYLEGSRTEVECQLKWQNYAHPNVCHEWTDEDEETLKKIARVHGYKDWNIIASEMGKGFTAFECLQKYQQRLNDDLYKKPYTEEEDKLLVHLVEKFRIGDFIPWQKVAYFSKDRKDRQCSFRWYSKLDPSLKSGKWSAMEDQMLFEAVKKWKGKDWTKVSQVIPGRCSRQCRNRWVNVLNPELRKGRFSSVEDLVLLESVKHCGIGHWTRIQIMVKESPDFLPGKSQPMLMSRYRHLAQLQTEKLQQEFKEKRSKFRKDCMVQQMTSMIGDTQVDLLEEMEETFEEYCRKFSKEELLDRMIVDAKKRVSDLGETAKWSNIAGASGGYSYEVNREAANKWKDGIRAAAKAARALKGLKISKPRMNTRHRRSGTVVSAPTTDVKNDLPRKQIEKLDDQLVNAVLPCRTLQPNKFFEKCGRTVTRLSRSEYITSELNQQKPLPWSTAVLLLMKASRVDVSLCKGIVHRCARLPNIKILSTKHKDITAAANNPSLTASPSRSKNHRPFTMILNKPDSSEMVSGQVIGRLPAATENTIPVQVKGKSSHGARLSGTKQDVSVPKQSNPVYVMKTSDRRILLVAEKSPAVGSPSGARFGSRYPSGAAGTRPQGTESGKIKMIQGKNSSMTQKRMSNVSECVTMVATPPKRVDSSRDGNETLKMGGKLNLLQMGGSSFNNSTSEKTILSAGLNDQVTVSETRSDHMPDHAAEGIGDGSVTMTTGQHLAGASTTQTNVISERPILPKPGTIATSGMPATQLLSQHTLPHKVVMPLGNVSSGNNVNLLGQVNGTTMPDGALRVASPQPLVNQSQYQKPKTVMFWVRTKSGPSTALPVVTSTSTVASPSIASQGTVQPSPCQLSSSPLHGNQAGYSDGGTIASIQQGNKTPSGVSHMVSSPLVLPSAGMISVASPCGASSLSSVTVPSTTSGGIYKLAQNSASVSLSNTIAGTKQSMVLGTLGTSLVPSTNGQGLPKFSGTSGVGASICHSGSGLIFSPQPNKKKLKPKILQRKRVLVQPDPYLNPKVIIGVNDARTRQSSVKLQSAKSSGGGSKGDAIVNDGNGNHQKNSSGPCLTSNVEHGTGDTGDECMTEEEGSVHKKVKTSHGHVSESGKTGSSQCADGIHCGTDNEGDGTVREKGKSPANGQVTTGLVVEGKTKESQPCSDGMHCGTDDEEDVTVKGAEQAKLSLSSSNKLDKNENPVCSDGIHCGTDDEEDSGAAGIKKVQESDKAQQKGTKDNGKPCSDGIHCGTDDEEDSGAAGIKKVHESCKTQQKGTKDSGKPCSDGIHCGTDDEDDKPAHTKSNDIIPTVAHGKVSTIPVVVKDKDMSKTCTDGIHCGTDDEDEIEGSKKAGSSQPTNDAPRTENGDESAMVNQHNKGGEVNTINSVDVTNTRVSSAPGSCETTYSGHGSGSSHPDAVSGAVSGNTNPGSGGDSALLAKEVNLSAKRPRRKAAPKPGSLVLSSTEEEDDMDSQYVNKFSKAKKLKTGQPEVINQGPSTLEGLQVPTSQLPGNILASSFMVSPGGSTTPSVGQMQQLPVIEKVTPFIATGQTILVGPGNVILGVLPGAKPISQLPQNVGVLPALNTVPNAVVQQLPLNNTVINNAPVLPTVHSLPNAAVRQPPLNNTVINNAQVFPVVNTLPSAAVQQPPLNNSVITNYFQPPNVLLQQPLGTTVRPNLITLPNVSTQQPVNSSNNTVPHSSTETPVLHQLGATNASVPSNPSANNIPSTRRITEPNQPPASHSNAPSPAPIVPTPMIPTCHAKRVNQGATPQQQISRNSESSTLKTAKTSGKTVKSLLGEEKNSGKSSTKSVAKILKEIEDMKPTKRAKGGMLPPLMKDDQYTVDMNKLEEFTKNILGTPTINFDNEMPTLPPNLITLFSFKHLLIKKISLERKASQFSMTSGELHEVITSTGVTVPRTWLEVLADDNAVDKQKFLTDMRKNYMYTLFKERFTMLFLWPAFLSLLKPFTPRPRRTVRSSSKRKHKLHRGRKSESKGKTVLLENDDAASEIIHELDKNITEEQESREGNAKNVKKGDGDVKKSVKKAKKIIVHKYPQLPTRRGTRSTPLRKNAVVKESVAKEVLPDSESREAEESPEKTS